MAYAPVAGRYAQALFELGVEEEQVEALDKALGELAKLMEESAELRIALFNPAIQLEERRGVLAAIAERAKWPGLFQNFIFLLLDKDRLRFVDDISRAYAEKVDDYKGQARARVTSAMALKDPQIEAIRKRLSELTGKEVILTADVDESLIGGIVARVGSTIYDGSVRTQLARMGEAILKEI